MDSAAKTIQKKSVKDEFQKASDCLVEMLKTEKYNGCYFDRTEKESLRLCTQEGWFTCQVLSEMNFLSGSCRTKHSCHFFSCGTSQGSHDQKMCPSLHSINPYSSRESRIIFSTWNLDHRFDPQTDLKYIFMAIKSRYMLRQGN